MKYHYLSEREFFSKCPCAGNLKSYVKTLVPTKTNIDFVLAEISDSDENTYIATYDVLASDETAARRLEVSCTELPCNEAQYKIVSDNEIR